MASTEKGHAIPSAGGAGMFLEENWDLRWPNSNRIYAKMAREDAQVRSTLAAVELPPQRTTWRIDPNGADPAMVQLVSEDLRLPVLGDDGRTPLAVSPGHASWNEHLAHAMKYLTYGVYFFEKVYKTIDGRDRLWKIAPRPPLTIREIKTDPDGGLRSIVQTPGPGGKKPHEIDVDRLLVYVNDPTAGWTGQSLLRPAYKHWVMKDQYLRLEGQVLQRNGMGVPVYTAGSPENQKEVDAGQEIAEGLTAGEHSGASLPYGAKLAIEGTKGQLVSPREAILYHDHAISKAALAHVLNLDGKGGSYALADTQLDMFEQSLQTTAEYVSITGTRYLIEPLCRVAFDLENEPTAGPFPKLTFDPIGSKKDLSPGDLAILVQAGIILPDRDLEEEVRRRGNLPGKRPLNDPNREETSQ
ncbi:hypothetical protein G6031_09595 [Dietzia sp. CQ4]|uniref:phage portal protein family protein n=1 Tax=Dietzia sp. (strain CQ4) TaxID=370437 RepID=UPI0015FD9C6C|nr:hypothetical protein [Dietzia sp. CQ4]MBB1034641.1 hypothetical protein [Dietzia sp. CQ4]